jgi:NTE family protein
MISMKKTGLILTGGGARAAYQVGVLKAVSELLGEPRENPFPILCGTSAGAINATALAIRANDFAGAVRYLVDVWEAFHCRDVYRSDWPGIIRSGNRWLSALMLLNRTNPISLLDNSPLRELLARTMEFERIQANIDSGALYAVSVTASGYTSGQSVTFYQGGSGVEDWERWQRVGASTTLNLDLLLASSALPFIFPAVKVHREFFGDGSMRQIAPISPALHLGADRVLVIGTGRQSQEPARVRSNLYPSLAQIAGHALNSIFLDSLAVDIERLQRINKTLQCVAPERAAEVGLTLRPIDVFVLQPRQPIERITARHVQHFPRAVRFLLRTVGAMNRNGSNLASYLLFEAPFTRALMELGYDDTMARKEEMLGFLRRGVEASATTPA